MRPPEFTILLHRALEFRIDHLVESLSVPGWPSAPEPLHQVRVASRRLRSVLGFLDPEIYPSLKKQVRRLKALTDVLGPVRERDVHVESLEELGHRLPGPTQWGALEHALECLHGECGKARRNLLDKLEDLEPLKIVRLLEAVPNLPSPLSEGDLHVAAWECLDPLIHRLMCALEMLPDEDEPRAYHAVRIQVKKLRYALEILEPALPAAAKGWMDRLKAIQSALGDHHDAAVLADVLRARREELESRGRHVLSSGLLHLLAILDGNRREALARYRDQMRQVEDHGGLVSCLCLDLAPAMPNA